MMFVVRLFRPARCSHPRRPTVRPRLETLEDRLTPGTLALANTIAVKPITVPASLVVKAEPVKAISNLFAGDPLGAPTGTGGSTKSNPKIAHPISILASPDLFLPKEGEKQAAEGGDLVSNNASTLVNPINSGEAKAAEVGIPSHNFRAASGTAGDTSLLRPLQETARSAPTGEGVAPINSAGSSGGGSSTQGGASSRSLPSAPTAPNSGSVTAAGISPVLSGGISA
jgi:hypothetical protein